MVRKRGFRVLLGAAAAIALSIAPLTAGFADTVNNGGADFCGWSNGPTVASTGCTYDATGSLGIAEVTWIGGFGPPTFSGVAWGATCSFVGGVGGSCIYNHGVGTVTVHVSGSTSGFTNDDPGFTASVTFATGCSWVPLDGGCSYGDIGGNVGTVTWVAGAEPALFGASYVRPCLAESIEGGTCQYIVSGSFGTPTTVTFAAALTSAGHGQ